jgi:hypothetical protein
MATRCVGTNKSGKPCSAKPLPGSDRCPWHDPAWDERRKEWSVRGGHGKSNRVRAAKRLPDNVLSTDELRGVLGKTLKDVISGDLEPAVGNAAASIARAYVAVTEAGAVETLQTEVEELRAMIAARGSA